MATCGAGLNNISQAESCPCRSRLYSVWLMCIHPLNVAHHRNKFQKNVVADYGGGCLWIANKRTRDEPDTVQHSARSRDRRGHHGAWHCHVPGQRRRGGAMGR
ncbi:hypothetical protein D9M73_238980 [compost metagenome]